MLWCSLQLKIPMLWHYHCWKCNRVYGKMDKILITYKQNIWSNLPPIFLFLLVAHHSTISASWREWRGLRTSSVPWRVTDSSHRRHPTISIVSTFAITDQARKWKREGWTSLHRRETWDRIGIDSWIRHQRICRCCGAACCMRRFNLSRRWCLQEYSDQ